jgi:hypothetical protein
MLFTFFLERGIDSDFTLALLMSAAAARKDLKVLLMVSIIGCFFDPLPLTGSFFSPPQLPPSASPLTWRLG